MKYKTEDTDVEPEEEEPKQQQRPKQQPKEPLKFSFQRSSSESKLSAASYGGQSTYQQRGGYNVRRQQQQQQYQQLQQQQQQQHHLHQQQLQYGGTSGATTDSGLSVKEQILRTRQMAKQSGGPGAKLERNEYNPLRKAHRNPTQLRNFARPDGGGSGGGGKTSPAGITKTDEEYFRSLQQAKKNQSPFSPLSPLSPNSGEVAASFGSRSYMEGVKRDFAEDSAYINYNNNNSNNNNSNNSNNDNDNNHGNYVDNHDYDNNDSHDDNSRLPPINASVNQSISQSSRESTALRHAESKVNRNQAVATAEVMPATTIVSSIRVMPRSNSSSMEIQIGTDENQEQQQQQQQQQQEQQQQQQQQQSQQQQTPPSPMSPTTVFSSSNSSSSPSRHLEHIEGTVFNPLAYQQDFSGDAAEFQREEMIKKIVVEKQKATANIDAMLRTIKNQLDQTEKERSEMIRECRRSQNRETIVGGGGGGGGGGGVVGV